MVCHQHSFSIQQLCVPLHILFNKCLSEGVFLCIWKRAFVTPIYKSGDKTNVENYRPISILPTLSKLFERLVHSNLFPHHITLFPNSMALFSCDLPPLHNLMIFKIFLFQSMDKGTQVDGVYALDCLQKLKKRRTLLGKLLRITRWHVVTKT